MPFVKLINAHFNAVFIFILPVMLYCCVDDVSLYEDLLSVNFIQGSRALTQTRTFVTCL